MAIVKYKKVVEVELKQGQVYSIYSDKYIVARVNNMGDEVAYVLTNLRNGNKWTDKSGLDCIAKCLMENKAVYLGDAKDVIKIEQGE